VGHVCLLNLNVNGTTARAAWNGGLADVDRARLRLTGARRRHGYGPFGQRPVIDEKNASQRLLEAARRFGRGRLSASETAEALLPESFEMIDADKSGSLSSAELIASHARAAEQLPNLAIPEMNGVGAMELR